MDRQTLIYGMVDAKGFGLEIGPSHAPVFPKAAGFNVETLDYTDAEGLRAKYSNDPAVDISRIEEVDFISDGRALDDVIPYTERYDFIFSSHVIEHVTDVAGYLKSCETLLKPGGVVALAVPDKRYTFDALQPVSTTGKVLEAYARGHTRHTPAAIFDFFSNFALLDGREVWSSADRGRITLSSHAAAAKPVFDDSLRAGHSYHDVHGWVFTPSSFRLILNDLRDLGLTTLAETALVEMHGLEFLVSLQKGAAVETVARIDLQKALVRENVVAGLRLLAADEPRMAEALERLEGVTS